jgi:hypothetical protein
MSSRQEIIRAHYARILRKTAAWAGLVALLSTMFVTVPAQAAQITTRSTTLGNSKAGATTTYKFDFTAGSSYTLKGLKFEICSSPLQTTSCTAVSSSTIIGATLSTQSANLSGATPAFTVNASSPSPTATAVMLSSSGGIAVTSATVLSVTLGNVVNPNVANTQFYTRVTTYTDTAGTTPSVNGSDFGAMAVSTGTEISVNANVQESIAFSVGQTGTCGSISGSSVNIGNNPGTDNVLQTSAATAGTSVMCVNTNASSGYVISYASNSAHNNAFTNGTYDIADNAAGNTFTSATAGGADFFGMNLVANTGTGGGPTAGAAVSGGVAPTAYGTGYGTAGTFAYVRGTQTTLVSETTGPTANTLYTVTYAAQAGTTTKTGAYQVKLNYMATGTF